MKIKFKSDLKKIEILFYLMYILLKERERVRRKEIL
jgi:hypothetical protein